MKEPIKSFVWILFSVWTMCVQFFFLPHNVFSFLIYLFGTITIILSSLVLYNHYRSKHEVTHSSR